jgi:hypothetical protein
MDLGGWLRSLGLGKYEAAFRDNEIDERVLPSLTHENLKELGVTAVGHRLKLLGAIAALRTDAVAKPPASDGTAPSNAPSASRQIVRSLMAQRPAAATDRHLPQRSESNAFG